MKLLFASQINEDGIAGSGFFTREERIFINSIGYYEFDESFGVTHRKHGRKDYYLSYNHGGKMKIRINQKEYEIGEGTVFLYRPFEEQYYGQADKESISNYWTHFTGYGVDELLIRAGLGQGNIFKTGVNGEIPILFEKIIDELNEKPHNSKYMSSLYFEQLVIIISRLFAFNDGENISSTNLRVRETIGFIHRNYNKTLSVKELADNAGLSHNRYTAVFKETTGVSPKEYIIHFRLQKARELMIHSNLNIRQISYLTGFENQLYFSRIFRKYSDKTPTDFINSSRHVPKDKKLTSGEGHVLLEN